MWLQTFGGLWHFWPPVADHRGPIAQASGPRLKRFACGMTTHAVKGGGDVPPSDPKYVCKQCLQQSTIQPKTTMPFLPTNYEEPQTAGGNYLRLEAGETAKVRVMSPSPLLGWEVWTEDVEGRKCHRREYTHEGFDALTALTTDRAKHFWSLVAWDYALRKLKIWHITQKTIKDALTALTKSNDWGDPVNYDLRVTRTGEGMKTKWGISPVPPVAPPPTEAIELLQSSPIRLERLLTGDDPFSSESNDIAF